MEDAGRAAREKFQLGCDLKNDSTAYKTAAVEIALGIQRQCTATVKCLVSKRSQVDELPTRAFGTSLNM